MKRLCNLPVGFSSLPSSSSSLPLPLGALPRRAFFSTAPLAQRKCSESATPLNPETLRQLKSQIDSAWEVVRASSPAVGQPAKCERLQRRWVVKDFLEGLALFDKIATVAEAQGHHPDLHLENYKHVTVELYTHTLPGISENDFIVAAQIDQLSKDFPRPSSS